MGILFTRQQVADKESSRKGRWKELFIVSRTKAGLFWGRVKVHIRIVGFARANKDDCIFSPESLTSLFPRAAPNIVIAARIQARKIALTRVFVRAKYRVTRLSCDVVSNCSFIPFFRLIQPTKTRVTEFNLFVLPFLKLKLHKFCFNTGESSFLTWCTYFRVIFWFSNFYINLYSNFVK